MIRINQEQEIVLTVVMSSCDLVETKKALLDAVSMFRGCDGMQGFPTLWCIARLLEQMEFTDTQFVHLTSFVESGEGESFNMRPIETKNEKTGKNPATEQ